VFVRLGTWQIDRRVERRALNVEREALAALPPLELSGTTPVPPTDSLLWRRVRLTGRWNYEDEVVIRGRAAFGSPGVHLVTPLRLEGGLEVLVLRGWLPAADGLSADFKSALPAPGDAARFDTVVVTGQVLPGESSSAIPPRFTRFETGVHLVLGSIDLEAAALDLEGPLLDAWVLPDPPAESAEGSVPRPVQSVPPSDGPHLMYAIQWFGFGVITVAGATLFLMGRRRDTRKGVQT
jgi:surfeit locus 1 family protein